MDSILENSNADITCDPNISSEHLLAHDKFGIAIHWTFLLGSHLSKMFINFEGKMYLPLVFFCHETPSFVLIDIYTNILKH